MTHYDASKFSAADAALGYLYQVRVALLWALRRNKTGQEFLVALETLDDVTFETAGQADELLQTKHHGGHNVALTDASVDLWKSLRVWFEASESGALPPGVVLSLLTTANAPDGSAAALLRPIDRDVDVALASLEMTAQSSTNQTNKAAYEAFLRASPAARRALLEQIVVIDSSPHASDLNESLREEVYWAADRDFLDPFLQRLEGWWFRRSLRNLAEAALGDRILSAELDAQMDDLREQFKKDALPVDDDLLQLALDEATQRLHENSTFVRQLELIKATRQRIANAVRDYYRAFEQRSRWLRDDLILVGELAKYEHRLVEEWQVMFEAMRNEVGDDAADDAKEKAARALLAWAEQASLPIRKNVTEPFVSRGSLHMLADTPRIGWHPEFRDRLAKLLNPAGGA